MLDRKQEAGMQSPEIIELRDPAGQSSATKLHTPLYISTAKLVY